MIRKAVILVLTLATIGTAGIGAVSFRLPIAETWEPPTVACKVFRSTSVTSRVRLARGIMSVRFCLLVDRQIIIPRRRVDMGGLTVRIETISPQTRPSVRGGFSLMPVRGDTPEEREEIRHLRNHNLVRVEVVRLPVWLPSILFAAYPAFAFIRGPLRRYRRRKKGLCIKCGYNLMGLPEPRCPECGTAVKEP